ncbi:HAMP domain-containing sensor histidine kinase [Ruegeria sp. ANG-R]|uniref:sensor histidine kinase n=1 Tax=Ruegeria sp. ANG-R TaxID=1577903 RepID=UPI000A499B6A|nr:HAMP domain-containing sensor histidine kinase [Ruegeria sp. ANG-R]
MLDLLLMQTALLIYPDVVDFADGAKPHGDEADRRALAELGNTPVYQLYGVDGVVTYRSPNPNGIVFPDTLAPSQFVSRDGYRFVSVQSAIEKPLLVVGLSAAKRNEHMLENLAGLLGALLLTIPAGFLAVQLSSRLIRRPVLKLADQISAVNEQNLKDIDPELTLQELRPAVESINHLTTRLEQTIAAERSFAANAAHELRTPSATALAHLQHLRASSDDAGLRDRILKAEDALKSLGIIVERLLQLSRADAGLGTAETAIDAGEILRLLLSERSGRPGSGDRLQMIGSGERFLTFVDADALAIILGNLIDNALAHGASEMPVEIDISTPGVIVVRNRGACLTPDDLEGLRRRHERGNRKTEGFGLGLAIVDALCRQANIDLRYTSPPMGWSDGLEVRLELPAAP